MIVAANKWDLMKEQGPEAAKVFDENLRYQLKFLDFAPILHISAATGERTPKLLEVVDAVYAATRKRVPTGELNRFIEKITSAAPPVTASRRNMRVMYAAQAAVAPPTFVLFTNSLTKLHFSYERFLENRLREEYGFVGAPIRIQIRGRAEQRGDDARKTARERAPERRSPVRKGPGLDAVEARAAEGGEQVRQQGRVGQAGARQGKAGKAGRAGGAGKAKGKPVSAKQKSRAPRSQTCRRSRDPSRGPSGRAAEGRMLYSPLDTASMAAPKRELFKAADVCEVVQVQPYVLRSWEAEFPQIGQVPAGGGPRAVSSIRRRAGPPDQAARLRRRPDAVGRATAPGRGRRPQGRAAPRSWSKRSSATACATACGTSRPDCSRFCRLLAKDGVEAAELQLVPPPPAEKKKTVAKAAKRK